MSPLPRSLALLTLGSALAAACASTPQPVDQGSREPAPTGTTEPEPATKPQAGGQCAAGERQLTPGCGNSVPFEDGCHRVCTDDASCGAGAKCVSVVFNPCADSFCDACGASAQICLAR